MNFEVIIEQDENIFNALVSGVRLHNFANVGSETSKPLSVVCRDNGGSLIGGVTGRTIYRQFLIDALWVEKSARGAGLGKKLMETAEVAAKARGCLAAQVDTLSF